MKIIETTRLRIADQKGIVNNIAKVYDSFYRAAMEYIDNSIDAGMDIINKKSVLDLKFKISVTIDTSKKKIIFIDNCGGMSPKELSGLINNIGLSKKKTVTWANGQFGYGVQSGRAFAKHIKFTSHKEGYPECSITIDRDTDENTDVPCTEPDKKIFGENSFGTTVEIYDFDKNIGLWNRGNHSERNFKKEIEKHFDDILRIGNFDIYVRVNNEPLKRCIFFNYNSEEGKELKKQIKIGDGKIDVDLKVLKRPLDDMLPSLRNKGRRINHIADLLSYKDFVKREYKKSLEIWENPFVVGGIEIHNLVSPNLVRKDLQINETTKEIYRAMYDIQLEIEKIIDENIRSKNEKDYASLGSMITEKLSQLLKGFKLDFEKKIPSSLEGETIGQLIQGTEIGGPEGSLGTGPGLDSSSGGTSPGPGKGGIGSGKGGEGNEKKKTEESGVSKELSKTYSAPQILFQPHANEGRIIDLGSSIIVNTAHPDFIERQDITAKGKFKLNKRLINYVSLVISPPLVHKKIEKSGKVIPPKEVGNYIIDLTTKLEEFLNEQEKDIELMVNY